MASLSLTTADRVHVIESREQMTLPAAAALSAGTVVYVDSNGKFAKADADAGDLSALPYGVTTKTVVSGMPVTAIARGVIGGIAFSSTAYWTAVLLSDTAGEITVTASESNGASADVVIGRIIPIWDQLIGGTPEKALRVML